MLVKYKLGHVEQINFKTHLFYTFFSHSLIPMMIQSFFTDGHSYIIRNLSKANYSKKMEKDIVGGAVIFLLPAESVLGNVRSELKP